MHTKDDEDFIDRDDDLADVLGEYDEETQRFDDERPLDEHPGRSAKDDEDAFFEETLKSLKTGRRSKMKLSPQEMENITQEMLYRMDKAHQDDLVSIAERRPALEKIKYVDQALMLMRKHQLQPMLLDFDLLSVRLPALSSGRGDGRLLAHVICHTAAHQEVDPPARGRHTAERRHPHQDAQHGR